MRILTFFNLFTARTSRIQKGRGGPTAGILLTLLLVSAPGAQGQESADDARNESIIVRILTLSGINFDGIPTFQETAIYGVAQPNAERDTSGEEIDLSLLLGTAPRRFSLRCDHPHRPKKLGVRHRHTSTSYSISHIPSLSCPFGVDRGFQGGLGALYLWIEHPNPDEPLKLRNQSEVLTSLVRYLAQQGSSQESNPFLNRSGQERESLLTLFTAIPTTRFVAEGDRRQLIEALKLGAENIVSEELGLNLEIARLLLGDRSVFDNWLRVPDEGPAWGLALKTRAMNLLAQTHEDPKFRGRLLMPLLASARGERIRGADQLLQDLRAGRIAIEAPPEVAKSIEQGLAAHATASNSQLVALIPLFGALAILGWAFVVRRSTRMLLFR